MSEHYTIVGLADRGLHDTKHGSQLRRYYLDLQAADGETYGGVFCQKKPDNTLKLGDEVYGHIEDGEYGPRFKGDPLPGGGFNGGAAQSLSEPASQENSRGEDPYARREEHPANAARMGRAKALELAVSLYVNDKVERPNLFPTADVLYGYITEGRGK